MKKAIALCFFFLPLIIFSQNAILEGYVFEDNNRGYLNEVKITILEQNTKAVIAEVETDRDGWFNCWVPLDKSLIVRAEKNVFYRRELLISTLEKESGEKIFVNMQMERQPGYLLELTLAESLNGSKEKNAVIGAQIEVYNHTQDSLEVSIDSHPNSFFSYTLQQGNHYTFLIRKQEYFNKRIEAYVNIEGCLICIDGVSDFAPGVTDNLTKGHQMGVLLANLDMEKAELNKTIRIENIYYPYNSSELSAEALEELNNFIVFLKENPVLLVEIGSHTDSRGDAKYNRRLSQERAQAVADYIAQTGEIVLERITAKGYGESQLINRCGNDSNCEEEEHQQNRRTEVKIIGFSSYNPYDVLSLQDIVYREREEKLLKEIQSSGTIQVKSGEDLPEEVKRQLQKGKKN